MARKCDFSGYATKNNVRCTDGRTILANAFKDNDGKKVPLMWRHMHDDIENVLGHAYLENRKDGVYFYATFNNSPKGQRAKEAVKHKDLDAVSIWADQLIHDANKGVMHGDIKELSLVLAGANPQARIDTVSIQHADGMLEEIEDQAVIYNGHNIRLSESDDILEHEDEEEDDDETIEDVYNTLSDKQKKVVEYLMAEVVNNTGEESDDEVKHSAEGGEEMNYNVFERQNGGADDQTVLTHDQMATIINDAKKFGSLKESFLAHAQDYGIEHIDYLFPDARTINDTPDFIKRDTDWVSVVMNGTHHTPFSRIKSIHADITEDEARARGYVKGNRKVDEIFSLLKRTTDPQTVYKRQKLDRDDIIDITDFEVVRWLKSEMRMMLNEELARAVLVGDGRLSSSNDKIKEDHIRPIWKDDDLYTIKVSVEVTASTTPDARARSTINAIIKSRKNYKGTGNPIAFMTEDLLTDMLLIEDTTGRTIYDSVDKLATKLRVSRIVTVPVMEGLTRAARTGVESETGKQYTLGVILVNLNDYNIGADKGGSVSLFDDFDIDYNQYKYLIETRCSGALIKPYSAIVVEFEYAASAG